MRAFVAIFFDGRRHFRRGFTLVEIMIVVAILGIMAAMVVPRFSNSSDMVRVNATVKDLRAFETAINVFAMKRGGQIPVKSRDLRNGIKDYLSAEALNTTPGVGGEFGFHSYSSTSTAAVSISGVSEPKLLVQIDELLDDGNLNTGRLRGVSADKIIFYVFGPVPN